LVHVEDVAQGVVAAVNHLLAAPTENATVEVFNLVEPEAPLATDLLAALRAQPHSPTCVRLPWRLHHTLAHVLSRLEIMLARPLPIPGLLRPDWMASRFCQLQFDVRRAQTVLGWEAKHRILNDLNTQRA
jgi:nucleoside-diphosphate-sugar epimerase